MSALWWYKLLFVTELILAETLICMRFERRKLWQVRLIAALAAVYSIAVFYPLPVSVAYSGWYVSLMFLVICAATFCGVISVFRISAASCLFCVITAYTIQHLSYEIYSVISILFSFTSRQIMYGDSIVDFSAFNLGAVIMLLVYFDVFVVICGVTYFIMRKYMRGDTYIRANGVMLLYSALILFIDVIINAFVVYIREYNRSYELVICIFNALCCLFVLYIQMTIVKQRDIEKEVTDLKATISEMGRQYALRRESIDLINRKCHDLRYQLARFAEGNKIDPEEFRKIETAIDIYDKTVKTGNGVLDVILTEKSLLCREKGVKLTCLADCSRFTFMKEGEIYALFGNLVDNAIEAVSRLNETEKRCISLNIRPVGEMLSIVIENYFAGNIEFSGGLPKTTKGDTDYHGYGLLSVDSIVKQYSGNFTVTADNGIFSALIFIPIPPA